MRLHDDDARPAFEADVLVCQVVKLDQHSLGQIPENDVSSLPSRVLRLRLPSQVFLLVKPDVNHRADGIMNDAMLGRQLCIQPHAHADEQWTHAEQLSSLGHVHDLQSTTIFCTVQGLLRRDVDGLRVHEHAFGASSIAHRAILHQALHCVPSDRHLEALPVLGLRQAAVFSRDLPPLDRFLDVIRKRLGHASRVCGRRAHDVEEPRQDGTLPPHLPAFLVPRNLRESQGLPQKHGMRQVLREHLPSDRHLIFPLRAFRHDEGDSAHAFLQRCQLHEVAEHDNERNAAEHVIGVVVQGRTGASAAAPSLAQAIGHAGEHLRRNQRDLFQDQGANILPGSPQLLGAPLQLRQGQPRRSFQEKTAVHRVPTDAACRRVRGCQRLHGVDAAIQVTQQTAQYPDYFGFARSAWATQKDAHLLGLLQATVPRPTGLPSLLIFQDPLNLIRR